MKCALCNKGIMIGRQHTHHAGVAGGRWKKRAPKTRKVFTPNLHSAKILVNGAMKRVRLCTKCLRKAKEAMHASIKIESKVNSTQSLTDQAVATV